MYRTVTLAKIDRNPGQPRKHFDPEMLAELATSIAANGLLEPIIVRPSPDQAGRYLIIAGERRWRASRDAGLAKVPVRVMDLDEAEAYVLSVAENVNRADMTLMEEVEAFQQLVAYGKSADDIAAMFGKRPAYIASRLTLLNLAPEARGLVEAGTMSSDLAWYVAKLKTGNQRAVANRWARGEFASATDAIQFAQALHESEQQTGFFDMAEPTLEEREEHAKKARAARKLVDQIDRAAAMLSDLAAAEPDALAAALGPELAGRLEAIERVAKVASRARTTMRKAKAAAEARSLAVSAEAVA